jgi:ribose transport system permease protein
MLPDASSETGQGKLKALLASSHPSRTLTERPFRANGEGRQQVVEACRRSSINVTGHLVKVYLLAGMLSGVAGYLSLARFATTTLGGHTTDNLQVIAGVVIGGTSLFGGSGGLMGSLIGIIIPVVLLNGFVVLGLPPFWQQVAVGAVLIGAVYFDQLRRRLRDR